MNTLHLIDTATLASMLKEETKASNKLNTELAKKKRFIQELQKLVELRKLTPTVITS